MQPTQNPPVEPVTAPVTSPATTLRDAALYLERHGWCQESYFAVTGVPTPPACAMGAISIAVHGYACPDDIYYGRGEDDRTDAKSTPLVHEAESVFADYLLRSGEVDPDTDGDLVSVGAWNDEDGRTAAQVITALRKAAYDYEHLQRYLDAYLDRLAATDTAGGDPS
jgi:hypothetical protein